jgi:phosphoribosylanthranilate isomerase
VSLERAAAISGALPDRVRRVGVFVDAERTEIERILGALRLDLLQFHGDESPEDCRGWTVPVIKAVRVRARQSLTRAAASYPVDFILADAYVEGQVGGTGRRVPLDLVDASLAGRLLLAGGLNPDNVAEAVRRLRPMAVDVASGVESAPGRKDPEKVRRFIENAQLA